MITAPSFRLITFSLPQAAPGGPGGFFLCDIAVGIAPIGDGPASLDDRPVQIGFAEEAGSDPAAVASIFILDDTADDLAIDLSPDPGCGILAGAPFFAVPLADLAAFRRIKTIEADFLLGDDQSIPIDDAGEAGRFILPCFLEEVEQKDAPQRAGHHQRAEAEQASFYHPPDMKYWSHSWRN